MKTRLIAFLIVLLAAGEWKISELQACTSFAVYVDSNRIFYGMNFDTLVRDILPEGRYIMRWCPGNLESGVYYIRLITDRTTETIKRLFVNNN
jgi:hypothetical protein